MLGKLYAVCGTIQWSTAEQNDESGAGTYNQRIGKYSQRLNQALLHGVADVCGCRHIGGGPHTGLVAEQPAFDALHQRHADTPSQSLLPSEGVADNECQDSRQLFDVQQNDDKCQCNVSQRHDGDDDAADFGYALYASKDDCQRECGDDPSHNGMVEPESASKAAHSVLLCTELNANPKVMVISTANSAPIHGCFSPLRI